MTQDTNTETTPSIARLKTGTPDLARQNVERLAELFPDCVTEGPKGDGPHIDFDLLRQALSDHLVEGPAERYRLDWPGKRQAMLLANTPTTKTLRPVRDDSVDFDTTRNLFIEGDNLEALKILQETYLGRVKMIYIDPPYNTGKDFIYRDNFRRSAAEELEASGQADEEGRLVANTEANGRFHSDWLSMMAPRLKLARSLLRDDGVIFVSFDANEVANMVSILDQAFGEGNFLGLISRVTGTPTGGGNDALVGEVDYIASYSRSPIVAIHGLDFSDDDASIYNKVDSSGRYLTRTLRRTGGEDRREDRPTMYFPISALDGSDIYPIGPTGYESRWICGRERFLELGALGLIEFIPPDQEGSSWQVHQKFYLEGRKKQPSDFWDNLEGNKSATRRLRKMFDDAKIFDNPKPTGLIERIAKISGAHDGDVVVDFFGGSGTTAEAIMTLNAESGQKVSYLMVQWPEELREDDAVSRTAADVCEGLGKAKNVAELAKERIRRAGAKILADHPEAKDTLDVGFRAFRIDSSNYHDTRLTVADAAAATDDAARADLLDGLTSHIKDDRTDEDLLFGALLAWGVDITLPIRRATVAGCEVILVDPAEDSDEDAALIACFARDVDVGLAAALAALTPRRVVFRDDGFVDDATKENVASRFQQLAPDTSLRVL